MKKRILIILYILLIVLLIRTITYLSINSILIKKYENGEYSEKHINILDLLFFSKGYVTNYNYGNILYKNGDYEGAIKKYKKALKSYVPSRKECNIRINYALAICNTVQLDESNQTSIKNAIKKYEGAIDVLTEQGCANKNDNHGHNSNAEKLKEDIQKEIDRLKRLLNNENKNQEEEKEEETEEDNKTTEEKIQEIKEAAIIEQRKKENDNMKKEKVYFDNRKNW